jgi:hypothetical protein
MLAHASDHGRGLRQCMNQHDLGSPLGPSDQPLLHASLRALILYPYAGLLAKRRRLRKHDPAVLRRFYWLSPLIGLGLLATGWGALREHLFRGRHRLTQEGMAGCQTPRGHVQSVV